MSFLTCAVDQIELKDENGDVRTMYYQSIWVQNFLLHHHPIGDVRLIKVGN